mmetsp:Transcript_10163/g.13867  ORF Transcript_10163/g.13867 Transcript_10163/m.13867 type:complete len:135 (+) Transcript_10163:686-1090(+)
MKKELDAVEKESAQVRSDALSKAKRMVYLGFAGTFAQWSGMTYMIYFASDWNEVEPYTFMFQAFYLMVGSYFYLGYRSDWAYDSIYNALQHRYTNDLARARGIDLEKATVLREYVERLDKQLGVLRNSNTINPD